MRNVSSIKIPWLFSIYFPLRYAIMVNLMIKILDNRHHVLRWTLGSSIYMIQEYNGNHRTWAPWVTYRTENITAFRRKYQDNIYYPHFESRQTRLRNVPQNWETQSRLKEVKPKRTLF
jgi:hypothetical protein